MIDDAGDANRTQLVADGRPVLEYSFNEQERPTADDAVSLADVDTVVGAVLAELEGWWLSTDDAALIEAVPAAGTTIVRHAHVYSRPLTPADAGPAWARELPAGLAWSTIDRDPAELAAVLVQAYGPDHVDDVSRSPEAEEPDLAALLSGSLVGPLLADASRLVIDRDQRIIAAVIVNRGTGEPPQGGPWVTELFRRPGPAYAGLGGLALDRAITVLAAAGESAVGLAVTDGNPARELYERFGFRHVSSRRKLAIP